MKKYEVRSAVINLVCSLGHEHIKLDRHNGRLVILHKENKHGRWDIRYLPKFRKEVTAELFDMVSNWVDSAFAEALKIGVGYYKKAKVINIRTGEVVERW